MKVYLITDDISSSKNREEISIEEMRTLVKKYSSKVDKTSFNMDNKRNIILKYKIKEDHFSYYITFIIKGFFNIRLDLSNPFEAIYHLIK